VNSVPGLQLSVERAIDDALTATNREIERPWATISTVCVG
jgi:hypothetical protein